MSFEMHARVRIGTGRTVYRVMHTGVNEAGRVLVQAEKSGRMKTVTPSILRRVRTAEQEIQTHG